MLFTWKFWKAALARAAHTAAQSAVGMIPVAVGVHEIQWLHVLSVAAAAAVVSILKSVIIGVPEVNEGGGE